MSSNPDDLEQLLLEVRKTIAENSRFLKKLGDESDDDEQEEQEERPADPDDFEEL